MNPAQAVNSMLVEQLQLLAESQGGTSGLRKIILNLAIRGRLSQAETGDDGVAEILSTAKQDRLAKLARGDARQMEELQPVVRGEAPFSLPHAWAWTRIGHAMNLVNGRAFKPNDWGSTGLPIVRIQNLNNADAPFNYCAFKVEPKHLIHTGDFLISWSGTPGTSFGAFIWQGPNGVLNQHIFRAEVYGNAYELGFARIAINARLDEMIAQAHGGVGLQHITKGKLEALAIPLPPLAEQKRIVAKVDQLMALCDELEARQATKRDISNRLTKSALQALTTAEGPEEFDAAWKRVVENFDVLIDRAEKVGELRAVVRALAYSGRLSRCASSRTDVQDMCSVIVDCPHSTPVWASEGIKCLRTTNFRVGGLDLSEVRWVSEITYNERIKRLKPDVGDIVYSREGGILGIACVIPDCGPVCLGQRMMLLRPNPDMVVPDFLALMLNAPQTLSTVATLTGGTASPHLNVGDVRRFAVPLPPVEEQRRIVAKVEQLMKVCDELEARLTRAEDRAAKLVEAVVQELVA